MADKKPVGRPKIEIDPAKVYELASFHCTNKEIAAFFECSPDTIERNYAVEVHKAREGGREKLRRLQWKAAEKGNVAMLIWMGKQILDQREKTDATLTTKDGAMEQAQEIIRSLTQMLKEPDVL